MSEFEREKRYVVLKESDLLAYLSDEEITELNAISSKVCAGRERDGKISLECVVVESDWLEYEQTWKAIEARVRGVTIKLCDNWPHTEPTMTTEAQRGQLSERAPC